MSIMFCPKHLVVSESERLWWYAGTNTGVLVYSRNKFFKTVVSKLLCFEKTLLMSRFEANGFC